jgi:cytochrome c551/c552
MRQQHILPLVLGTWLLGSPPGMAASAGAVDPAAARPDATESAAGRGAPGPLLAQGMMGPGMMWPGRMGRGGMMGPGMMGPRMGQPGGWGAAPPSSGSAADNAAVSPAAQRLAGYVGDNRLACFSCHAMNSRLVGPAFDDVARRYASQPHAPAWLAQSIANGVSGRWGGPVPMPPGQASPAQARALAGLILGLAR